MALLYLDLYNFKTVNNTLDHDVSYLLLKQVSKVLTDTVRSGDTVSRLCGDEFAIILTNLRKPDYAAGVARKILDQFHRLSFCHWMRKLAPWRQLVSGWQSKRHKIIKIISAEHYIKITINLYTHELDGLNVTELFISKINELGIVKDEIVLELTETSVMHDLEKYIIKFQRCILLTQW